jgi:hypothetical protein
MFWPHYPKVAERSIGGGEIPTATLGSSDIVIPAITPYPPYNVSLFAAPGTTAPLLRTTHHLVLSLLALFSNHMASTMRFFRDRIQ